MISFQKTICPNVFGSPARPKSVMAIPGIIPQKWKPHIRYEIGTAWPKKAKNGREYFKLKFDCIQASSGKALYAKLWSRKQDPRTYDLYVHDGDLPFVASPPFSNTIYPSIHGFS